jgi:hypothetical protein
MTVDRVIGLSPQNVRRFTDAATKAALVLEVLGFYVRVRVLLLQGGLVPTVAALRAGVREEIGMDVDASRLLRGRAFGRAVVKVLGILPADGRCLMRSLVLTAMLARRGIFSRVVLGVRTEPRFAAHAWVEIDGHAVLPADESWYPRLVEL